MKLFFSCLLLLGLVASATGCSRPETAVVPPPADPAAQAAADAEYEKQQYDN